MSTKALYFLMIFVCIISIDSHAQTGWQWGKCSRFSSSITDIELNTAAVDRAGNVIAAGLVDNGDSVYFGSSLVRTTNYLVVTKLDPAGNFLWTVTSSDDPCQAISVATDKENNIYVLGTVDRFVSAYSDTFSIGSFSIIDSVVGAQMEFLVKISPAGVVQWLKGITFMQNASGINGFNYGKVSVDSNDNVYLISCTSQPTLTLGTTTLTNPSTTGADDIYVARLDSNGNYIWAKNMLSPAHLGLSATVDKGGNMVIACRPASDTLKFGSASMPLGVPVATIGGSVFSISNTGAAAFLFNYPSNVWISDIATDNAGNIYPVGTMESTVTIGTDTLHLYSGIFGASDMFMSKYNSSGTFIKAWNAGGDSQTLACSINIDLCGNIWVGAGMRGANGGGYSIPSSYVVHFNSDSLSTNSAATDLLVLARYDTSGNYLSSTWLPSGGDDQWTLVNDMRGNFYVAGDYMGTPMVIAHDTLPTTAIFSENFFVAKYIYYTVTCLPESLTASQQHSYKGQVTAFPNPASDDCTISSAVPFTSSCNAQICDVTGRCLKTIQLHGNTTTFSVADLPQGVYICVIHFADGSATSRKILVMK